jgi:SMC interacting uncharacterized protein involved in chromosome segregation
MKTKEEILQESILHSVLTVCNECGGKGVNKPGNTTCGNCLSDDTFTYFEVNGVKDAMQLYSDQQNKHTEERLKVLVKENDNLIFEKQKLDQQNKELREDNTKLVFAYKQLEESSRQNAESALSALNTIKDQQAEIQRLTKEVEELKEEIVKRNWGIIESGVLRLELTRLRELLNRCKPLLESDKIYNIEAADILSEINALNHKP